MDLATVEESIQNIIDIDDHEKQLITNPRLFNEEKISLKRKYTEIDSPVEICSQKYFFC